MRPGRRTRPPPRPPTTTSPGRSAAPRTWWPPTARWHASGWPPATLSGSFCWTFSCRTGAHGPHRRRTTMDEHRSALLVLQRTVAGGASDAAGVSAAELERALVHVASCEGCGRRFDVAETAAWLESREDTQAMAQVPVDPAALFERALTAAVSYTHLRAHETRHDL